MCPRPSGSWTCSSRPSPTTSPTGSRAAGCPGRRSRRCRASTRRDRSARSRQVGSRSPASRGHSTAASRRSRSGSTRGRGSRRALLPCRRPTPGGSGSTSGTPVPATTALRSARPTRRRICSRHAERNPSHPEQPAGTRPPSRSPSAPPHVPPTDGGHTSANHQGARRTMRTIPRSLGLAAVAATLAVSLTACGGSSTTAAGTDNSDAAASAPATSPSGDAMMSDQPFGAACSAVPDTGKGSFDGMSQDPVATAASNNPVLSTLVSAVTQAKLVDTLNSAQDITVLAPTNDAFAAMDKATLKKAMGDPTGLLSKVLTYHVLKGKIAPDQLAGSHESLEGGMVSITGSGEDFKVDGAATVVCGNVQTANATVYLIDKVLLPKA